MKESFLIFKSFYEPIKGLSTEDKGTLLDAIFQYQIEGIEPTNTSRIYMPFMFFKNQFRLDNIKYEKIVERNKINGSKGGRPKNPIIPKKPTGLIGNPKNPSEPKKPDNDNDNVKDKVKDKVKDTKISDFYFEYPFFKDEFAKIWFNEFIPLKKSKKGSLTDRALKSQLKKIAGISNSSYKTALEVLEKSVNSGWTDFYELKTNGKQEIAPPKLPEIIIKHGMDG